MQSEPTEPDLAHGIDVRVLGPFRIRGVAADNCGLIESRFHVRALLALLASSDEAWPRDQLLETLWPDRSPDAARNRLYHTVHLLKDALASMGNAREWLTLEQGQVQLAADVESDARYVERAITRLEQGSLTDAELRQAIGSIGGEWGSTVGEALEASELGRSLRSRFAVWHLALLQESARRAVAGGDSPCARNKLAVLLDREPADEWAHQQLMRWDLAARRWHAVLQRYTQLQRELAQHLGLRPSLASWELAEQAREAARRAHPARERTSPLIGREALCARLGEALDGSPGVWNVHGLPGAGKTSLVKEVVRTCAAHFEDGVIEVALGDLDSDESAIEACTRLLRLAVVPGESATQRLQRMLRTRHILLVVDDADQRRDVRALVDAVREVTSPSERETSDAMVAAVVLVTRKAVLVDSVHDIAVGPLAVPARGEESETAIATPAVALFFSRCPQVMLQVDSQTIGEVGALVRELDGLPLAIEFAAARSATMTPTEILPAIRESLNLLEETSWMVEARHPSMHAALDWSVGLLSTRSREFYVAASVFAGAFDMDALTALGDPSSSQGGAADGLHELVSCGLLQQTTASDGRPSFRMLHLPKTHARALARAQGSWEKLQQRRLETLHAQLPRLPTYFEPGYVAAMTKAAALHEEILGLLPHARTHDPVRFLDLIITFGQYWKFAPALELGLRWFAEANTLAARRGDSTRACMTGAYMAALLHYAGQSADAMDWAQTARTAAVRLGDVSLIALTTFTCCTVLTSLGRVNEVAPLIAQTILDFGLNESTREYWLLQVRLWSLRLHGADGTDLKPTAELVEFLRPRLEDSSIWPLVLCTAGFELMVGGRPAEGLDLAEEVVRFGREINALVTEYMGLEVRWHCELALGLVAVADQTIARAARLARDVGFDNMATQTHLQRVAIALYQENLDLASQHLARCSETRYLPDRGPGPELTAYRGMAACLRADLHTAGTLFVEASALASQCRPDQLVTVAELGALLARRMGLEETSREIAYVLSEVDDVWNVIPIARQFRERHFPHPSLREEPAPSERDRLLRLKRQIVELAETISRC